MRRKALILAAALCIVASDACAAGSESSESQRAGAERQDKAGFSTRQAAAFQQLLDDAVAKGAPGIQAYIRMGNSQWSGVAGMASIETGRHLTVDTPMRQASITKLFTATVVHQLVAEGALDLSQPPSAYLPRTVLDGIENVDQVTLAQLLDHSSGLYNATDDESGFYAAHWRGPARLWSPLEVLGFARDRKPHHQPGKGSAYSNTNYFLLGLIVEQVESRSLEQSYRARIFEPFGLKQTFVEGREVSKLAVAQSYETPITPGGLGERAGIGEGRKAVRGDGLINLSQDRQDRFNAWAWATGAIAAPAEEIGRFLFLGAIESKAPHLQTWKPVRDWEDDRFRYMGGGAWGITSVAWWFVEAKAVIVVSINVSASGFEPNDVAAEIARTLGLLQTGG